MPESLYGKLVALLLAVLAVVGLVQIVLMFHFSQRYFQEVTQDVNRTVAQEVAKRRIISSGGQFDPSALQQLFSELMTTHPSIEAYALDRSGNILAFSAPPGAVVLRSVSLEPIRKFLTGARLPVLGDDPRAIGRRKVFSAFPVRTASDAEAALAGYIYVVLEGQQYQSAAQRLRGSYILQQGILAAAACLAFALVSASYLLRLLTRRLARLAQVMQHFEASGFTEPPLLRPRSDKVDEIDRLEGSFINMASCMVGQVKQISSADSLRRELFANISHDLRTPLASLQGYLETLLLKERELSPEQQHEFLRIAARHSAQLGLLIEDLFELAKLDSAQAPLNREPVSLAELVQDAAQKFQLAAHRKAVRLELQLSRDLPLVCADVRLMARVIDNLFDNAFRYTDAGGVVTAVVQAADGKVQVCVGDDGCGIAATDLPHIFDRFFQAAPQGKPLPGATNGRGIGLGLAIVKRILERHGASLAVSSAIGTGTRFTFELDALRETRAA